MVVMAVQSVVLCERFDEAACDARSGVARLLTELSSATTQVVLVPVYLRAPPPPTSISVPEYLSRHITTRSSTRSLRSSSAPLLHIPFRRTSFGKRSFSTAAPSVRNSLPVSVQNCDTLTLFKSRLKARLFSSVFAS